MAIDLREDARLQMMMARNLGGDIGSGIGNYQNYKRNERRRQERENRLPPILQRFATDENYTEEQALSDISKIPGLADVAADAWFRSYQSPEERAYQRSRANYYNRAGSGGAGGDMTRYKALKTQRDNLEERWDVADGEEAEILLEQIRQLDSQMDAITKGYLPSPESLRTRGPAPAPFSADVDAVTGAAPVMPSTQQPAAQAPSAALSASGAQAGPPTPPGFINRNWLQGPEHQPGEFAQVDIPPPTPQQAKADAAIAKEIEPAPQTQAEPPDQEYFYQMVRHIGQTDREAAKVYYDKWKELWL